ncbi:PKD domain-containing protein [Marinilabiliaceae bacterium JC017]|nr:PKD domain-containing protein [Marinilabiliaceae bacterium JC017]
MKRIISFLGLLCLVISISEAQDFEENFESKGKKRLYYDCHWYQLMKSSEPNVLEVMKAYTSYFEGKEIVESLETREYKKWLRKIGTNFDAQGNLLKTAANEADNSIIKAASSQLKSTGNAWSSLGPDKVDMKAPMQSGHTTQGVVRSVAIDPTNSNIVLAASVSAGIWRTVDGGSTWNCVTNDLLVKDLKGIAFCKNSPNVVYAASRSGALKSTNGGVSWNLTGLDWTGYYPKGEEPKNIVVDPNNPDKAYMATSKGLYVTEDGGDSWSQKFSRETWDVEMHPSNSAVIYAVVSNNNGWNNRWVEFWRSVDYGESWTNVLQGYPINEDSNENIGRAEIAVSAAAPNNVWVVCPGGINMGNTNQVEGIHGIYKSTNSGETFGHLCCGSEGVEVNPSPDAPNMIDYDDNGVGTGGGQYTWDMAFAVSDTDPDYMLFGGINVWKSIDGGNSWSCVKRGNPQSSKVWTHYDIQGITIKGNHTWITSDGGMHYSDDQCGTITNKSFGFVGIEVWGFDQGWKSDIMGIGMYHGPIQIRDDNTYDGWYVSSGADAGTVMVNKGDDQYIYARPWGSVKITRSKDRMTQPVVVDLGANCPNYLNPIETFHHRYYHTFYTFDGSKLLRTTDNAATWNVMKDFGSGYNVSRITTGYLNPDVVCVIVNYNTVYRSMDGGDNWTNITPSNTVSKGKSFSNIAIGGDDSNIIWVTMGGKQSDVKVLKTIDGGGIWTDYSGPAGKLPSYQINHIAHQLGTNGGVYIANSVGVWYRNNSMSEWKSFCKGLPVATDTWYIRLNYAKNKIRIGTMRGVWENDLYESSSTIANAMVTNKEVAAKVPVSFVDHSVVLEDANYAWSFPGGTPSSSTDEKPQIIYPEAGTYDVSLTVTDANGTSSRSYNSMVNVSVVQPAIDKTNWRLLSVDSEQSGEGANFAFDNNITTHWHTEWSPSSPDYPHEIQIDLGESYCLEAFSILPRQDGSQNGMIKDYEFYVSVDGLNWGTPVKIGTWSNSSSVKKEFFTAKTGRYIRLVGKAEVNGNVWASAAEIDVYGSTITGIKETNLNQPNVQVCSQNRIIYLRHDLDVESTVQIFSVNGQLIAQKKLSKYDREVNFMNAMPGLYIVRLIVDRKIVSKKVIVQ